MNEEVNINLLLDRLYTTGKIDKRYMWALKDYITNLQEENERLNNQYDLMENSLDEKQEVIDKSIEYINNFWKKKSYYEDIDNCMKYATINEFDKADLLNILQGEDKE